MKYFSMNEFECRFWCKMPEAVKENIEALVTDVLDPIRDMFGRAIKVNSGYRCHQHNTEIGSTNRSQHVAGQASDVCAEPRDYDNMMAWKKANLEIARLIIKQGLFDQLILENVGEKDLLPTWVHVSYRKEGPNRQQVLKKVAGRRGYLTVSGEEIRRLLRERRGLF